MNLIKIPLWILIWLCASFFIVTCWDLLYIFFRPSTFADEASWLWFPYLEYIKLDPAYADPKNAFIKAQAIMSALENGLVLTCLFSHFSQRYNLAIILALLASSLTCAKTILIFVLEAVSGFASIGHNPWHVLFVNYYLTNGIWIVFPLLVVLTLSRMILRKIDG